MVVHSEIFEILVQPESKYTYDDDFYFIFVQIPDQYSR